MAGGDLRFGAMDLRRDPWGFRPRRVVSQGGKPILMEANPISRGAIFPHPHTHITPQKNKYIESSDLSHEIVRYTS